SDLSDITEIGDRSSAWQQLSKHGVIWKTRKCASSVSHLSSIVKRISHAPPSKSSGPAGDDRAIKVESACCSITPWPPSHVCYRIRFHFVFTLTHFFCRDVVVSTR